MIDDTLADCIAVSPNTVSNVLRESGKVRLGFDFSGMQLGISHMVAKRLTDRA